VNISVKLDVLTISFFDFFRRGKDFYHLKKSQQSQVVHSVAAVHCLSLVGWL
jgi:hypothetical protein